MIKEIDEREAALEMRLPNADKFAFYEASRIVMKAFIRLAHRYAELAREMAASEADPVRKQELLAIAETCEWVPQHPARNLAREAIQCHFFCHIVSEIEQVGCGYSEAYLGQNLEPFYQADKAAGLIDYDDAVFMFENLVIKLNEIGYYYGEKVALQNSADLGQSISLGGYTEDGDDATAEMDYVVLDACSYLHLPQPPLTCVYTEKMSGKFIEKVLDVIGTGIGMPQFVNGDVMVKRALNLFAGLQAWLLTRKGQTHLHRRLRGQLHPLRDRPPGGRAARSGEGYRADAEQRLRPPHQAAGRAQDRGSRNLQDLQRFTRHSRRRSTQRGGPSPRRLDRQYAVRQLLPTTWRSLLTGGYIKTGTEVWNGGANYYTTAQIVVGGIDAANSLMAVKKVVYDDKKITMAELKNRRWPPTGRDTSTSASCAMRLPSMATTSPR